MNLTAKEKILNVLTKTYGYKYNTITVAQARARFRIENVSARVHELRKDGWSIYTNKKTLSDGRKITFYRLGSPSNKFDRLYNKGKYKEAIRALYSQALRA